MEENLTGLGIFMRAATETVPHLTAVGLDLGLMAVAPQADKPWACRVTVSLMRPGKDGLTQDVVDIERLASLGHGVLARLGQGTVFAAAVTGAGERTWLLYTGGTDVATVTATVRDAAVLAFADQADYVPRVAVESDPAWVAYRSLYPAPAETREIAAQRAEAKAVATARATTQVAVASLHAGDDPVSVRYRLTFPSNGARSTFVPRLMTSPFRPETATGPQPVSEGDGKTLDVIRDGPADFATIHKAERWLIREVIRVGGRYDGWSLPEADERLRLVA